MKKSAWLGLIAVNALVYAVSKKRKERFDEANERFFEEVLKHTTAYKMMEAECEEN